MEQQRTLQQERKTIAIVGGRPNGALTACHLEREPSNARILLMDPAPSAGSGLAYSTGSLRHLLSVPAGNMSASPDEPDHFSIWLRASYDHHATPKTFAPCAVFGRRVQTIVAELTRVERVRAYVVDCRLSGSGAMLTLASGRCIRLAFLLLKSLFQQGLATYGPRGAGFDVTPTGALIAAYGAPSNILFNVGPGRQGTLLESIAVPEIREQAAAMAKHLNTSELQCAPAAAA